MSHARMKTVFLHFSNYLPWSISFIAAAVGKPGFRGISTFLVCFCFSRNDKMFELLTFYRKATHI